VKKVPKVPKVHNPLKTQDFSLEPFWNLWNLSDLFDVETPGICQVDTWRIGRLPNNTSASSPLIAG
jgi:hypothetical protein